VGGSVAEITPRPGVNVSHTSSQQPGARDAPCLFTSADSVFAASSTTTRAAKASAAASSGALSSAVSSTTSVAGAAGAAEALSLAGGATIRAASCRVVAPPEPWYSSTSRASARTRTLAASAPLAIALLRPSSFLKQTERTARVACARRCWLR